MEEFRAKKCFGQNFLINKHIQEKIVNLGNIEGQDVIEIGPGQGALTYLMIDKVKKLTCYEIDRDLHQKLTKEIKNKNVEIKLQDFLEAELPNSKYIVIGNIPYNITSDILFKLIDNSENISKAVLMVQKEVAERITAKANSKEYGKLTVSLNYIGECKLEFIVKANNFNPAPKVDSAIISITFNKELEYPKYEFLKFVKNLFQYKRKTLINNLINVYSKNSLIEALNKLNLDLNVRAETLDLEVIKQLYKLLN
ncbi:dimethyladenosine transferase [Metamycoplasma cloacale]|uniref:Ribosomal RNA small subunit methyltransferase A n=1 Tax=Metamycoplasma cloacale TaxID=92401 RepID=A0A2Z4LLR0_9BACT|nr:16S rRNA (adenine(1518)-N(6)/adenine(1519)-N(6))-dimethyltransferase RsmA [Metamycoplasma cloacale]AWX42614.1 ribosomal RNA small subunit methyltransferase A [Metamycoplasma cloacale]VEU79634.1 dimethyladenosine transferase [Metamycoplasma cloacale]